MKCCIQSAQNCIRTAYKPKAAALGHFSLLFFINDVVDTMPAGSTSKLYADDLKLYSVVSEYDDRKEVIQDSLNRLSMWSAMWQLQISYRKCAILELASSEAQ